MEPDYFAILRLEPGRHALEVIDRQYQAVRREIRRQGGPQRQRRLDELWIAYALLRQPGRQAALARRLRPPAPRPARPELGPLARLRSVPAGSFVPPGRAVPAASPPSAPPAPKAGPGGDDAHARFARMVCEHVEGGVLRLTARRRLVLLAGGLGIGEFKANLIIAEVLHDLGQGLSPSPRPRGRPLLNSAAPAERFRYGLRLAWTLAAALALDLLLMLWLMRL